jgi:hypothetical protein
MSEFIPTTLFQMHGPKPDEYDHGMIDTLLRGWNSHFDHSPDHPRVGDYIIMPDGSYERAAYVWEDGVQTCTSGSFAFSQCGASMSGSLNPSIPMEKLVNTGEKKAGNFWVFHHDFWMADNAVGFSCACRVFKVL